MMTLEHFPMLALLEKASGLLTGWHWDWLIVLGLCGNAVFSMRFLVQWVASEREGRSVVPTSFWYLSIVGSVLLCSYFIVRRDPVGVIGYLPNCAIYFRNLFLIRRHGEKNEAH
jgi:lipid-A-disaccharide synthase-like uncharacterized protein